MSESTDYRQILIDVLAHEANSIATARDRLLIFLDELERSNWASNHEAEMCELDTSIEELNELFQGAGTLLEQLERPSLEERLKEFIDDRYQGSASFVYIDELKKLL